MLDALAGHDPKDPSSVQRPAGSFVPGPADAADVLKAVRILLPRNYYFENIDPDVRRVVLLAAQAVEAAGGTFVMGPVPDANQLNAVANVTFSVEAASVHEPSLRKRRADYGLDVAATMDVGRAIPATAYVQAQRLRTRLQQSGACPSTRRIASCPRLSRRRPADRANHFDVVGQMEDVRIASTRLLRGNNAWLPHGGRPGRLPPAGLPWASS